MALFAIVAAPVIAHYGSDALEGWRHRLQRPVRVHPPAAFGSYLLNWALLSLALVAAGIKMSQPLSTELNEKVTADMLPVDAVRFLQTEQPPGPLFNSYNWGGYLIWELPDYPVFVDGRTDLYDDEFLTEYLSIFLAQEGWEEGLDRYQINLVLIEPESMLGRILEEQGHWQLLYDDHQAMVFAHDFRAADP
jgi:hypothetical protein